MPWTVRDVDRHKRGLTDAQKRQWVEVANSALRSCLARGGQQATCEASAIRQANGVAGHMERFTQTNRNYQVREQTHQGRRHLVVPVVMMVEGVHSGSHGPLLHPAEELGRWPGAWNGIPVVVDHPQVDGMSVSANDPQIIDRAVVGRIYNTRMDGIQLKAEAWLDEEKLRQVSSVALGAIHQGHSLEVSIGVFTDDDQTPGEWHGEAYEAIARNHRPDHLALLPDEVGACSWDDGCGVRLNNKGGIVMKIPKTLEELKLHVMNQLLDNADQDYKELLQNMQRQLDTMDSENKVHFLEGLYDDYVVYRVSGEGGSHYYKQSYQVLDDGSVDLTGHPTEVRKKVEFVAAMQRGNKTNVKQNEEVTTMSEKKKSETPCENCEKLVNELITNKRTKWTEEDKEFLLTLEEDKLVKLIPEKEKEPEKPEPVQVNKEEAMKVLRESVSKPEEFFKILPPELRGSMESGLRLFQERNTQMIEAIKKETDAFTDEELKVMAPDLLAKTHKAIVESKVDYTPMSGVTQATDTDTVEPLIPAEYRKPEKKEE